MQQAARVQRLHRLHVPGRADRVRRDRRSSSSSPSEEGDRGLHHRPVSAESPSAGIAGIERLGRLVRTALKDVLDAFAQGDVAKARDVWERDEEIDQVYTGLFRELLTYMMEDPRTITACTHLMFMAKNIERAGDHVTNIAELVSFRATGHGFEEDRPKGSAAMYATTGNAAGPTP
jgi:phosphate uptake regulator